MLLRTAADSDDQGQPVTGLAVVDIVTGEEHVFELRSRDVPLAVELVDSFCERMHPDSRTGCKQALKEHLLETGHWQLQAPRLNLGPEVTISTSQGATEYDHVLGIVDVVNPMGSAAQFKLFAGNLSDRAKVVSAFCEKHNFEPIQPCMELLLEETDLIVAHVTLNSATPVEVAGGEGDRQNMPMPASHEQTDVLARHAHARMHTHARSHNFTHSVTRTCTQMLTQDHFEPKSRTWKARQELRTLVMGKKLANDASHRKCISEGVITVVGASPGFIQVYRLGHLHTCGV